MTKKMLLIVCAVCLLVSQTAYAQDYDRPAGYGNMPLGTIVGAYVAYKDTTSVYVKSGYGECDGNYWENSTDYTLSLSGVLTSAADFIYIYVDDSETQRAAVFIGSTTEPAWSDSKLGFYNGNDRCIGAVYSPSGTSTIMKFISNSSNRYIYDTNVRILTSGIADGTNQTLEATAYTPVNSIAAYTSIGNVGDSNEVRFGIVAYEGNYVQLLIYGYQNQTIRGWVDFNRGASRDFKYWGDTNDVDNIYVDIYGYQVER